MRRYGGDPDPPPLELYSLTAKDISRGRIAMDRWSLCERFHWTLDEVDKLSLGDIFELIQVDDGRMRADEQMRKK
jgi:hypothetical protein